MTVRRETELSVERLREVLDYNPETGDFIWRSSGSGRKLGQPAGSPWSNGHRTIMIDNIPYQAARLAWLYVNGEYPPNGGKIKFVDGDQLNLRFDNLRLAFTRKEHNALFRERHPKATRFFNLKKNYNGMTEADYMALYVAQDGKCAICDQPESATREGKVRWLCVDHCHKTHDIRGLLCSACNTAIGYANDEPERLDRCAAYLRAHLANKAVN